LQIKHVIVRVDVKAALKTTVHSCG